MASKKMGVYLSESSADILERYTGGAVSTSGAINSIIERYSWAVKNSLPDLKSKEWETLLNVYSGRDLSSYNPPYRIASDMMDSMGEIDINALEQHNPSYAAIVKKVHALSQVEQLAILDFCQRFWSRDWSDFNDFDEIKDAIIGCSV